MPSSLYTFTGEKMKYTIEQFKLAVLASRSIRQVLNKLGLKPAGGNYSTFHKLVAKNNIDISHLKKQGWNKGMLFGPKRPIKDYLSNKHGIQSNALKKRLIREGIFQHKCSTCKGTEWLGNPIPIELDHINGNSSDNSLDNLRILCPNCHALTPTYRGKNKSRA